MYNIARLLTITIILFASQAIYPQQNKPYNIQGIVNNKDTNFISSIVYPPLTAKEGKGLDIPRPPADHPRLYLSKKDLPALRNKINNPVFREAWDKMSRSSRLVTNGMLRQDGSRHNLDISIRNAIEAKAFQYVIAGNDSMGKEAVTAIQNFYASLHIEMSRPDVCRDVGRAIVTGAIVYDWCYPLLTAAQKQLLIGRMETLATQLEVNWPQLTQGSIVGHGVEAQLSRDMLSCGIATYNEKPAIYNLVAGRMMAEFVPVRKFFYPAAYHHQGSSYGPYRFNWDVQATLIFDRLGYPDIFGKDQAKVPYYFLYSRRPDGQLLRNGDDFIELFTPFGKYWTLGNQHGYAGTYFNDPVLINETLKEAQIGKGADYLFDFLYFDNANTSSVTKSSLPLTSYFPEPFGAMVARTGWEEGMASPSVVAEMKVGTHNFVNHQHLDAGSFQLYYKGPLAVQSGIYQGTNGSYGGAHFKNYLQRSIAHNTMLFYDPAEKFYYHKEEILNDGGQPYPNRGDEPRNIEAFLANGYKTGEVLAHQFGPDPIKPEYSYIKGQLAPAYSSKVKSFQRSFVFLNMDDAGMPGALIVFDQVETASKDFKKYWLLHSVQEPAIRGSVTTIVRNEKGYNGKLVLTTLLPHAGNLTVEKIGGAGNEYNVFGKNFPQSPANKESNSVDSASWRIQVSPRDAAAQDVFLNVMEVSDAGTDQAKLPVPQLIETPQYTGAKIGNRIVLFSKNGQPVTNNAALTITGDGDYKVLIADAGKGAWQLERKGKILLELKNDKEVLYFTVTAGQYTIKRKP